jgi:hypothetical protein
MESRTFCRSDFWKTPNGKHPPYLIAIVERAEPISDSKWGSLFRHRKTGKIGVLMYIDPQSYIFDRPEICMNRHGLGDKAQHKTESLYSWQEVSGTLELYVEWSGETFPLSKEEGPLKDFNDLL